MYLARELMKCLMVNFDENLQIYPMFLLILLDISILSIDFFNNVCYNGSRG